MKKRDYLIIMAIFATVSLTGLWVARNSTRVQIIYPKESPILLEKDFTVHINDGHVSIGKTSMEEVMSLLPGGKTLGMSTVYKTSSPECIFTFNGDRTILKKIHIPNNQVCTNRGIKVGDPLQKVTEAYGPNYIYSGKGRQLKDFEAIYSADKKRSIILQIRDSKVNQIVLVEEMWPEKNKP